MRITTDELVKSRATDDEFAEICERHYVPFILQFIAVHKITNVLLVGCNDGGSLRPFAERGCHVMGIDSDSLRLRKISNYFSVNGLSVELIHGDILSINPEEYSFDLILIITETIDIVSYTRKLKVLNHVKSFLGADGLIFVSFSPWYIPFHSSHYQCRNRALSFIPFLHLLPKWLYRFILKDIFHEEKETINKMIEMRSGKMSIESFRRLIDNCNCMIKAERMYFITPLFSVRYKVKPKILNHKLAK